MDRTTFNEFGTYGMMLALKDGKGLWHGRG